jgi:hypothetical protein
MCRLSKFDRFLNKIQSKYDHTRTQRLIPGSEFFLEISVRVIMKFI